MLKINDGRWIEIVGKINDALIDSIPPCDDEDTITQEEFDDVMEFLYSKNPFDS